jgi:hypothetical protein
VSKLFQSRKREGQITSENGECENQRADPKVAGPASRCPHPRTGRLPGVLGSEEAREIGELS